MLLWRACYNHSTQLLEKKLMGNAGGKCREKKHNIQYSYFNLNQTSCLQDCCEIIHQRQMKDVDC